MPKKNTTTQETTAVLEPTGEVEEQSPERDDQQPTTEEVDTNEDVDFYGETEEDSEVPSQQKKSFGVWSRETAENKGFKVLLYGPSGAGKTRMAATFPNPLFLDLEGGLRTVLQVKDVLRFPYDSREEVETLNQVREFYRLVKKDPEPEYDSIVVDSLNELQHLVTKEVLSVYDVSRQYEDQLTLQDYAKINRVFLNIIRLFLKLPFHIIFTAVETPREYEEQEVYPKFTGKQIWPELQRMMEQIGYVHVIKGKEGPEHVVSFLLHPSYVAKDRIGIKERWLPNNYEAIAHYLSE